MTDSPDTLRILFSRFISGYAQGLMSPVLALHTNAPPDDSAIYGQLWQGLQKAASDWPEFDHVDGDLTQDALTKTVFANPLAEWLLSSAMWLQSLAGVPITSHGLSGPIAPDQNGLSLMVPTQSPALSGLVRLLVAILETTNAALRLGAISSVDFAGLQKACQTLKEEMAQFPPNMSYLLCAARRRNIPASYEIGQYYIFGQGRRQVLLNSSLPGHESCFGAATAKSKTTTNMLLRKFGLPVAEQVSVASVENAQAEAARLGFPVVLKPADLDGGNGVFPFLQDPQALAEAWDLCRAKSTKLILEKHVFGRDYRLLVARGELIAAIERKPAQVVGDGQQTIAALLAAENERRKPQPGQPALFYPLPNDDQAQAILKAQGLTFDDVPAPGVIARLRMAPNHAQGGTVGWCLDQVHPENLRLALYVAEVMRLDVAGIDLICADIAEPWSAAEAAICEVNHQPSLGRPTVHDVFGRLLDTLLPDGATIPQIAVFGPLDAVAATLTQLVAQLSGNGRRIGSVRADGAYIGDNRIAAGTSFYQRHRILNDHPGVDLILLGITSPQDLQRGLACPTVDFVVPATPAVAGPAQVFAKTYGARLVAADGLRVG